MKAIIRVGWNDERVVSLKDAETILSILEKAPRYKSKWMNDAKAHYVWDEPEVEQRSLDILTEEQFKVGKLAGKPDQD